MNSINSFTYFIKNTIKTLDKEKHSISNKLITDSIIKNEFLISPLIISEFFHTLSKLKMTTETIITSKNFFKDYIKYVIDKSIVLKSMDLALEIDVKNHINDVIHIIMAEKYCDKLITYDKDFKRFIGKVNIEIEILE